MNHARHPFALIPHPSVAKLCAILLALVFCPRALAELDMRIQWQLDGPLDRLVAFVREGRALQNEINPDVGHELWVDEFHGDNTNSVNLIVRYRDPVHFAEATAREEASAEWQSFVQRFPAERYPTTFVGLNTVLMNDDVPVAKPGTVMTVIVFDARGGQQDLVGLVERGAEIQGRINPKAQISLVAPVMAGDGVGSAVVLVRYPSLEAWAEGQKRTQESEAWAKFIDDFPADRFRIVYQGMSRALDID